MPLLADFAERAARFINRRATAYRTTFTGIGPSRVVLEDLSKFCRANESTFHPDSHVAARLDGRREVWLRVMQHLNLTQEELFRLYSGAQKNSGE